MRNPIAGVLQSIFAFTALLAVAGVHAAQNITIVEANSVTNDIRSVSFTSPAPPGSTTVLNSDQSSLGRLVSLTFNPEHNTDTNTFTVGLLAADSLNHHILRYAGCPPAPPSTPPCSSPGKVVTAAASIRFPAGLTEDGAGNLFTVDNAPGSSPLAQVWGLQGDGTGDFLTPQGPIDTTTANGGSLGAQQRLVATMIVPTPLGTSANGTPTNTGDLVVASNSPDALLLYPGNGATGPLNPEPPKTLIPPCAKPHGPGPTTNCLVAGSLPQSVAALPDKSLLVTLQSGSIIRFTLAGPNSTEVISSGFPGTLYGISTGWAGGAAVAFVAQSGPGNHGSILEVGLCEDNPSNPACTNNLNPPGVVLLASVTSGVAAPLTVASTTTVQGPLADCALDDGCDFFRDGTLKHKLSGNTANLTKNLVEKLCVVRHDPRVDALGNCNGQPLVVNQVCAGFDNTNGVNPMIIPGWLCGGSGKKQNGFATPTSFALIQALTDTSQFPGTYNQTEQVTDAVLPGPNNPLCKPGGTGVVAVGKLRNEGQDVESTAIGQPTLVENTDGCGSGKSGYAGTSLWAVGLFYNQSAAPGGTTVGFVQMKYTDLQQTVSNLAPNITAPTSTNLTNCIANSLNDFTTATSSADPAKQKAYFQAAANLLTNADTFNNTTCDYIVSNNPGAFSPSPPVVNPFGPFYNPSGEVRWRLANVKYWIDQQILLNPATGWPPPLSISASGVDTTLGAVNLTWTIDNNTINPNTCSLTSGDVVYTGAPLTGLVQPLAIQPPSPDGIYYAYTITCSVPDGTTVPPVGPPGSEKVSATAWVVRF
jgi:hypothetical protein